MLLSMLLSGTGALHAASPVRETIASGGELELPTPNGWKSRCFFGPGDHDWSVTLTPTNGAHARCRFTFAPLRENFPDADKLREGLLQRCREFVPTSVEKEARLHSLKLTRGFGFYCVLTDARLVGQPSPADDYKVMVVAAMKVASREIAVMTLMCDDADGPEMKATLDAVEQMKFHGSGGLTPPKDWPINPWLRLVYLLKNW